MSELIEEIKPCPFCGSAKPLLYDDGEQMICCNNYDCGNYDQVMTFESWQDRPSQWIPAEARLPEKEGDYLVIADDGDVKIAAFRVGYRGYWMTSSVIFAWRELPPAYQKEK